MAARMTLDRLARVARRHPLPIRWRLTLWYAALLATALLLLSGGLYLGLRRLLHDALDDTIRAQAELAMGNILLQDGTLQLPVSAVQNPRQGEQFLRLFDSRGAIVTDTGAGNVDGVPLVAPDVAAALAGQTQWRTLTAEGESMRLLTAPVAIDGQIVGALQVGRFNDEAERPLRLLLALLAVSGPLVLLTATLGGYLLAQRALAPVNRITRLAGAIGERDLTRRVDLTLPADEVGQLAATFNGMLDRIEEAFRRQRRFTADASHELRTPLSLVRGQIELALARPRDPLEDQQTFEALGEDIERLSRLAQTLLALARSDADALRLNREETDLATLVDLVAEQYAPAATEAGVRVVVDAAPVRLAADGDRLLQVLVNLFDNALRHTPAGGTITIGCRTDADAVRLWVADTGEGIAAEHLPHLFERFYRAEASRDRRRGGIGLGLSISKEIVEAHGGTITVESAPGAGAIFTVSLPRDRGTESRSVTAERPRGMVVGAR